MQLAVFTDVAAWSLFIPHLFDFLLGQHRQKRIIAPGCAVSGTWPPARHDAHWLLLIAIPDCNSACYYGVYFLPLCMPLVHATHSFVNPIPSASVVHGVAKSDACL